MRLCYKVKIVYRDGEIFIITIIIYFLLLYIQQSGSNLIPKAKQVQTTKNVSNNIIVPQSQKLKANFYHHPKNKNSFNVNNHNYDGDIHRDKLSRRDLDEDIEDDEVYTRSENDEDSAQEEIQDFLQEVPPETLKGIKSLIAVNPLVGTEVLSNVITGTGSLYSSSKKKNKKNKYSSQLHHHQQQHQRHHNFDYSEDVRSEFEKALVKAALKAKLKHNGGLKKPKSTTASPLRIYENSKKKPIVLENLEIFQVPPPHILYKNENHETTTQEPRTTESQSSNFIYFDHIISQVDSGNYGEAVPTVSSHRILDQHQQQPQIQTQQQQINNNNNNNHYNNNQYSNQSPNVQNLHHPLPTSYIQNGQGVLIQSHPTQYPFNNNNPQTNLHNNNQHHHHHNLVTQHQHSQIQTTVTPHVNTNSYLHQNNYQGIPSPTPSFVTNNNNQNHFIPSVPRQTPALFQHQQQQQNHQPLNHYPQHNNNNHVYNPNNPNNYNQYNQIPNHNHNPSVPLISDASHTPPLVYFHPEQQQQQQQQQQHFIPSPYYHPPHYNNPNYFNGYNPQHYNNYSTNSNENNDQKNKHDHHQKHKHHHDFIHNSLHSLKNALFGEFHHHHHHGKGEKGDKNKGDTGSNYNNNNNNDQMNYESGDHSKANSYSQVSESAYNHYSKKAEGLLEKAKEFIHHHHQKHQEEKSGSHHHHQHHDLNSVASKIFGISIMVMSFVAFGIYIVNLLFQFAVTYLMSESGMELIGQAIQQAMGRSLTNTFRNSSSSNNTNTRNLTINSGSPLLCHDANNTVFTSFIDELERRIRKALSNHKLFR